MERWFSRKKGKDEAGRDPVGEVCLSPGIQNRYKVFLTDFFSAANADGSGKASAVLADFGPPNCR